MLLPKSSTNMASPNFASVKYAKRPRSLLRRFIIFLTVAKVSLMLHTLFCSFRAKPNLVRLLVKRRMRAPANLGSLQSSIALLVLRFLMPDATCEVVGRACSDEHKTANR